MEHLAVAINILDLQTYPLEQSQSTRIDEGQTDPLLWVVNTAQEPSDLLLTENHGQFLLLRRA